IFLTFRAKDVYAVMGDAGTAPLRVYVQVNRQPLDQLSRGQDIQIDEQGRTYVEVTRQDLYRLVSKPLFNSHLVTLFSDSPDFRFYTFTFGPKNVNRNSPAFILYALHFPLDNPPASGDHAVTPETHLERRRRCCS